MKERIIQDVKFNCDVSDARYWGYFSICGLLMRMRDLYRSEHSLQPWSVIRQEEISPWIARKEDRWPELESAEFCPVTCNGQEYDPFDVSGVNQALEPLCLVYGAGYALYKKPTFFLADLRSRQWVRDFDVHTSGHELARDLFAAPAMLQGRCIFLRLETLGEHLWDTYHAIRGKDGQHPAELMAGSGLSFGDGGEEAFRSQLAAVAQRYSDILLHHELGEALEDIPEWADILSELQDRKVEYYLRSLKDLIADTSDHGPLRRIIESRDSGALLFFVFSMEGYRRSLFPELREAMRALSGDVGWSSLENVRTAGYGKFFAIRNDIMRDHRSASSAGDFEQRIREYLT